MIFFIVSSSFCSQILSAYIYQPVPMSFVFVPSHSNRAVIKIFYHSGKVVDRAAREQGWVTQTLYACKLGGNFLYFESVG
jgi:hypothetical protein